MNILCSAKEKQEKYHDSLALASGTGPTNNTVNADAGGGMPCKSVLTMFSN